MNNFITSTAGSRRLSDFALLLLAVYAVSWDEPRGMIMYIGLMAVILFNSLMEWKNRWKLVALFGFGAPIVFEIIKLKRHL